MRFISSRGGCLISKVHNAKRTRAVALLGGLLLVLAVAPDRFFTPDRRPCALPLEATEAGPT